MSRFKIEYQVVELELAQPFTISRGTKTTVPNVIVTLTANGISGYGEAGPNRRYNEDTVKVVNLLDSVSADFFEDIRSPEVLAQKLEKHYSSIKSAQTALEMAWLDWWSKSQAQPLWKLWETPSNKTPSTSYTIGLDEVEVIQQKVEAAREYPILKVKLGTDRDREIITAIREITDKPIRVDANEGWTDLETAKAQISFMEDQNIELVEQPMPANCHGELEKLNEWSPLPLMADESFVGDENLEQITREFSGINIKLMKMGSLVKARETIKKARQLDLQVMVGCMIESSLGIAAGALIGTLADYVDLDGFLLIKNDPFEGLAITDQKEIVLKDEIGLTVSPGSLPKSA